MTADRLATPAFRSLRAYWGTAVLLAAAGGAGIAVLAPALALAGPAGHGPAPLALPPTHGLDFGLAWSTLLWSPDAIRAAAVAGLSRLLRGIALGVLAVTLLSILSLSSVRAAARAPEMAVRRAVGASRLRLLATALLEGAIPTLAAVVAGGSAGFGLTRFALGRWPGTALPVLLPAVAASLAAVAGIALGALLPLRAARRRSGLATAEATPLVLVVPALQLGLSLTVLVAASLLARGAGVGLARAAGAQHSTADVYTITTRNVTPARRAAAYAALLHALHARRGAGVASLASRGTTVGLGPVDGVMTDCGDCSWGGLPLPWHFPRVVHYLASADTFRALGLPLVAGRGFTDADAWGAAPVAIVSRSLALHDFEAAGAVGRKILVGHGTDSLATVVGVVADRRSVAFGGGLEPAKAVYLSILQHPAPAVELTVRGGEQGAAVATARRVLGGHLAGVAHRTGGALEAAEAAPLRWFSAMFRLEGWAMLVIAAIGTFAVMWLWVTSLFADLGLRRAVGAGRRTVLRHVLARAAAVAAAGLAVALWLGMMLWDAARAAVTGLPAWDAAAVLRYGALLAATALAGALIPAWRAARAAPARLLAGPS